MKNSNFPLTQFFLFIIFFALIFSNKSIAQYTLIPDSNFEQKLIDLGIDTEGTLDGQILTADAVAQSSLNISNSSISNLSGIKDFINLTSLICHTNNLTILNMSNLPNLTVLDCGANQISTLNLTDNTLLTVLYCHINDLSVLDLTLNPAITNLICHSNNLTSLDVSNLSNLTSLDCGANQISTLNLPANIALVTLYCPINNLSVLDLTLNPAITNLICHSNNLTSLDVSNLLNLTVLDCGANQISTLNLNANIALVTLYCHINNLSVLDLILNTSLTTMHCYNNPLLSSLDIRNVNNTIIPNAGFNALNNPMLTCIDVDNAVWSTANWTNLDAGTVFSEACSLLPIELINFEASLIKNNVQLTWSTASELNNSGFEIQRSSADTPWEKIGFVESQGNSVEINEYDFIDRTPIEGDNYYRLKQIDFDGHFEFSKTVFVKNMASDIHFNVYPNPSDQEVTITIDNPSGANMEIRLSDQLGRDIWSIELKESTTTWRKEFQLKQNGLYFITIQTGKTMRTEKLVINN